MNRTLKIIVGIFSVVFLIGVVLLVLGIGLVRRSFTTTDGTVRVHNIIATVTVYRDDYGVPHIEAENDLDAFFAVGYLHAQDRLWQLELHRRLGLGRLAEVLGKDALPMDRMYRTLGFQRIAECLETVLDEQTRNALQAYCNGINEYITLHKGAYPLEFDMLQFEPEPWTVQHTLLVSRLMAWELNYARWVDMTCAALVDRVGESMAREAFPYWEPTAPLILPETKRLKAIAHLLKQFHETEQMLFQWTGGVPLVSGSNAWVVSGTRSTTGKPILANDPHLFLMVPARWYELHIATPTLQVGGMTISGVPFVVVGRNESIAWGVTNAMLDDADFYFEEVDSVSSPTRYRSGNAWLPVQRREETLYVKDDKPVLLTIYSTERGPIINAIEPSAQFMGQLVSLRWTGFEVTNEPAAFYAINKARNWNEFLSALKTFGVPAQNFVYGDTAGNIGYIMGGIIPVRSFGGVTLPLEGWNATHSWHGFVPFSENPKTLNPPEGFIVTANNKIAGDAYPYYLSSHWEPPWRARRLWQLLTKEAMVSPKEMERIQNDVHSLQGEDIMPYILHAFDSVKAVQADVRIALEYLRNWNYETHSEDVATTLFEVTLHHLLHNTFCDEMGDTLFSVYNTLASIPLTAIVRVLQNPQSPWFDDIRTAHIETREEILRKSLGDALEDLHARLGGEIKEWQWGRLHTVAFDHVFSAHPLLKRIFRVGPFPTGGTHSTVNVGYYFLSSPYTCTVGASMRQIMNLADINDTRVILPPGQSGQLYHPHYDDQVPLWLNGAYRLRTMVGEDKTKFPAKLLLEPVE